MHYLGHSYAALLRTTAHCMLLTTALLVVARVWPYWRSYYSYGCSTAVVFYRRNMMLAGLLGLGPGAYSCK
jgi:hypothetical protein